MWPQDVADIQKFLRFTGNANRYGKDKIDNLLDSPARFSATLYSSYSVAMEEDKQIPAVQDTPVLRWRDYTRDGVTARTMWKNHISIT